MSEQQHMRVLTLNVWNREGDYGSRGPVLKQAIAALQPDLVGLQEVESLQLEELFAESGYSIAWASHLGIASRWSIAEWKQTVLPGR